MWSLDTNAIFHTRKSQCNVFNLCRSNLITSNVYNIVTSSMQT